MHATIPGLQRAVYQRGTTLIVTIVLILLASLLAVFAMNVGLFEQRASSADVRTRLVQQTAEAALSQGVEYLKANRANLDPSDTTKWARCGATDPTFPCNTVPVCANGEETGAGVCAADADGNSTSRRGSMYYWIGSAGYDVNNNSQTNDNMDTRSLPIGRLINSTGTTGTVGNGFSVDYGVGAVMCMVMTPPTATSPTECTTDSSLAAGTNIFTVTSVASVRGESKTTLSNSFGISSSIASPLNHPPVVASGSIDITGGIQVVTNPDGAGHGVPVSIWTREAVSKTGTPNTCYMEDYLRNQKGNVTVAFEPKADGSTSDVITCDDCGCSNSLSYDQSGNNAAGGPDILDIDTIPVSGTSACTAAGGGTNCKTDYNVRSNEFPCDLFQLVFKTQAWEDDLGSAPSDGYCTDGHDCFCETRMLTNDFTPADGSALPTGGIGIDEAYLYKNATYIVPNTNLHPSGWIDPGKLDTNCSSFATSAGASAAGGIIWVQDPSKCNFKSQIGTVDWPVVLVVDGNMTGANKFQGRMFGILFVRAPDSPLDPATGGSADGAGGSFFMNANSVIYGSVIVQGQVIKGNGTAAIVYSSKVLAALNKEPNINPGSALPASWTDRFAY